MQFSKITHPFHEVLSKRHILFMHEWRVNSNKQMVRLAKITPYEHLWNWWFKSPRKSILSKVNLLKVFWNTFHTPINSKLCNTGDHSQWKKTVKKTKTTINTLLPLCPRWIILESLFLKTSFLGPKTAKNQ